MPCTVSNIGRASVMGHKGSDSSLWVGKSIRLLRATSEALRWGKGESVFLPISVALCLQLKLRQQSSIGKLHSPHSKNKNVWNHSPDCWVGSLWSALSVKQLVGHQMVVSLFKESSCAGTSCLGHINTRSETTFRFSKNWFLFSEKHTWHTKYTTQTNLFKSCLVCVTLKENILLWSQAKNGRA